jgi:hypothetical protein
MPGPSKQERARRSAFEEMKIGQTPARPGPAPTEAVSQAPTPTGRSVIEELEPSRMSPDRFQPRPILPVGLHTRLFSSAADCYQVAREWLKLAERDAGHRARVDELLQMADTLDEHGQIKAITGTWEQRADGSFLFRIETGERRFWSACLRRVQQGQAEEPRLRVEAVHAPSVERQIIENRHAQPPNAVAQAREIAALVVRQLGKEPDASVADPYVFFRQAVEMPRRPQGLWPKIEGVMQMSSARMIQLLNVLRFPTELLEEADRYNLPERVLREILSQPEETWPALVRAAIRDGLTADDIAHQVVVLPPEKRKPPTPSADPARRAMRSLIGFRRVMADIDKRRRVRVLDDLADDAMVRGEAQDLLALFEELAVLLRARVKRASQTASRPASRRSPRKGSR